MDDHDRPHYLSRDLEDLEDFDSSGIFDARALDEEEAPTVAPTQAEEGGGDPEPRDLEPASLAPAYGLPGMPATRRQREPSSAHRARPAMPSHERRALPARIRGRGIACVVVMFTDGRKVVLR
jgi:hypothetical protein